MNSLHVYLYAPRSSARYANQLVIIWHGGPDEPSARRAHFPGIDRRKFLSEIPNPFEPNLGSGTGIRLERQTGVHVQLNV